VILVCGIPSEPPLALAVAAAERSGIPAVVLSQRQIDAWALTVELCDGELRGELRGPDGSWPLDAFDGVYARLVDPPSLPEVRGDRAKGAGEERLARAQALHDALLAWFEVARCRVANPMGPMTSNVSKPYQAQLILRCGFDVPPTLITNDPADVRRFVREHGRVIYKSISSVRSIVRELRPGRAFDLALIRNLPTQFQGHVAGNDVRVHVVGSEVIATRVRSDAIDYRYAGRDGRETVLEAAELPPSVHDRCLALSRELRLPFCGIDLRHGDDGRWCCFEVNPSPAYSYYEEHTGQPISQALVDYLAGGDEKARDGSTDRERCADIRHPAPGAAP
jgi:hypothetical protein